MQGFPVPAHRSEAPLLGELTQHRDKLILLTVGQLRGIHLWLVGQPRLDQTHGAHLQNALGTDKRRRGEKDYDNEVGDRPGLLHTAPPLRSHTPELVRDIAIDSLKETLASAVPVRFKGGCPDPTPSLRQRPWLLPARRVAVAGRAMLIILAITV